jgi:hypothetical protein
VKKEAKALVRSARRQGWSLDTSGRHPKLVAPNGAKVPFSQNARGSYVATVRLMRKHGYVPERERAR